jgi:hypothetical protein
MIKKIEDPRGHQEISALIMRLHFSPGLLTVKLTKRLVLSKIQVKVMFFKDLHLILHPFSIDQCISQELDQGDRGYHKQLKLASILLVKMKINMCQRKSLEEAVMFCLNLILMSAIQLATVFSIEYCAKLKTSVYQ